VPLEMALERVKTKLFGAASVVHREEVS